MNVAKSLEIKEIENNAIKKYIPGILLMESAAEKVVKIMEQECQKLHKKKIAVVCGIGNNGGDGFAVARKLYNIAKSVDIYFIEEKEKLPENARLNFEIAKNMGINFIDKINFKNYDIIVDAIFGIGINRKIENEYEDIIKLINSSNKKVISIDIPSGVVSDTGEIMGIAVKADITITFHIAKPGHFLFPGRENCGKLFIEDIGVIEENTNFKTEVLLKKEIKIKEREKNINKMSAGKVMVIAGSRNYTGAAQLCVKGALRSGAGIVYLITIDEAKTVFDISIPEAVKIYLKSENGFLYNGAEKEIIEKIKELKVDSIVVGPGLGRGEFNKKILTEILKESGVPVVIDADALFYYGELNEKNIRRNIVITPHEGEFERINGEKIRTRIESAEKYSKENSGVLVLKGTDSLICSEGKVSINTTGNPGMAKAGMGDILAGLIGGLCARNYDVLTAAKYGVYIHGAAGDKAKSYHSQESLVAGDILENIGSFFL